jgi:CheY-like chemotaxis protein
MTSVATASREDLIRALPYARRYARALTGSQAAGDELVAESLKAIMAGDVDPAWRGNARFMLYGGVTARVQAARPDAEAGLTQQQRQLLLLTTLEEVPLSEAAPLVGVAAERADEVLQAARDMLRGSASTDVLIIEDEPIIAMDIEELVVSCGHRVVGVAATESEAVALAARERPGLILADINLGSGGDGANAVARIMRHLDAPVIFVTAYPERLLTGEALEPAFIISKPFEPLTLAIATFQAVTGGVRLD